MMLWLYNGQLHYIAAHQQMEALFFLLTTQNSIYERFATNCATTNISIVTITVLKGSML